VDEVQDCIWVKVIERSDWKTHGFDRPIIRVSGTPVHWMKKQTVKVGFIQWRAQKKAYYWSLSGECRWRETVIRFSDSSINWLFVVCGFIEKNDRKKGELAWHHGV